MNTLPRQSRAFIEGCGLSGCRISPFYPDSRAVQTKTMAKARLMSFVGTNATIQTWDNSGNSTGTYSEPYTLQQSSVTPSAILTDVYNSVNTALQSDSSQTYAQSDYSMVWPETIILPPVPATYQTIVSQTGTAVPAVGGSLTPINTYSGVPTFTWARTGAGVYTLTASSAVFNTSGKTAVFVGPLNNLNGATTAVVTSSTVITITTAIQSLAVLGLLGFTATPTDALMTNTMVSVQTFA